jgi:hypothetical protein
MINIKTHTSRILYSLQPGAEAASARMRQLQAELAGGSGLDHRPQAEGQRISSNMSKHHIGNL